MKKIVITMLATVAAFALMTGVAINSSAQASVLGSDIASTTWKNVSTRGRIMNASNVLNKGAKGDHRFVNVTVKNISNTRFTFIGVILTGSGSFDDYVDCKENEVTSYFSACQYKINPGETRKFTAHLDNSSWFKDRKGFYLETFDNIDDNSLAYTFDGLGW
jgi:hypothetical protein